MAGTDSGSLLVVAVTMQRHANFFLRVYVAPVCFLLLLIPVIFLLPPDSSEKLTYGMFITHNIYTTKIYVPIFLKKMLHTFFL